MITFFSKYLLPIAIALSFAAGAIFDAKVLKQKINLKCPECPSLSCPEQKPCNGIDFDKIKSKGITIHNTQHLTVDGSAEFEKALIKKIDSLLNARAVYRVKGKGISSRSRYETLEDVTDTTKVLYTLVW